jgi:peptidyl-prolyl cis-trans isomerase-like 6
MANTGPHTNGSQFYITLGPQNWMDTRFVAFGYFIPDILTFFTLRSHLIEGYKTMRILEETQTNNEYPIAKITIGDSGVYVAN